MKTEIKENQRTKHLPFSRTLLERVRRQSELGVPEIFPGLEGSGVSGISTGRYVNEESFLKEKELFHRRPFLVGFREKVSRTGDCISANFLDRDWILLRDEKNDLKGFENACLHRGTRLISGADTKSIRKIVCPYHSWTYDFDGELLTGGCKVGNNKLREIPLIEIAGMIFAGKTSEILNQINPIRNELDEYNLDSYVPFALLKEEGEYNWKVGVEIFLETYHIATLHRNSVAAVVEKNSSVYDPIGEHARILIPNRTYKAAETPSRKDLIITYFIFPSTILVLFRDHFGIIQFQPLSPSKTRCIRAVLIPEKPKTDRMIRFWEGNRDFFFRTTSEDLELAPEIHAGIRQRERIYPSSWEPGIFHFHRSLENAE
ncbi:aromatic ring-hydroxylating oxygenase subunit alpha [Leptospira gomenensis]|uniref:aromatic ring-hydroxylating oxygenase subunit alpha n=1 Tax=Leptospira gomenensis TaxID=2484974 RepID=UPI001FEA6FF5|nr:aromatic ring-hydroxylating dioxygenase subunit alpha [Leptospira gomenensis]